MAELSRVAICFTESVTNCSCDFILDIEKCLCSGGVFTVFAFEAEGRRIGVQIERPFSSATQIKDEREIQHLEAITRERIPHLPHLIGYGLDLRPP